MVSSSGNESDPKNNTPIQKLFTRNPKYNSTMPIAMGMRSVTIQTHHTSP
jgi:hypothetical protein